jgi:hypothetical protein
MLVSSILLTRGRSVLAAGQPSRGHPPGQTLGRHPLLEQAPTDGSPNDLEVAVRRLCDFGTASLWFCGEGGETLGEHGYSKDYRPDLKQMILGLVVDGSGTPICTEMWPGNTADVTAMSVVVPYSVFVAGEFWLRG